VSTFLGKDQGEIPNLFHLMELESRAENKAAVGTVQTFQYVTMKGWIPIIYSDIVPLDSYQKFGSIHTTTERESDARKMI
jgi:hypothetical protein